MTKPWTMHRKTRPSFSQGYIDLGWAGDWLSKEAPRIVKNCKEQGHKTERIRYRYYLSVYCKKCGYKYRIETK